MAVGQLQRAQGQTLQPSIPFGKGSGIFLVVKKTLKGNLHLSK